MARYLCAVLFLICVALGTALYVKTTGRNPWKELLEFALEQGHTMAQASAAPGDNSARESAQPASAGWQTALDGQADPPTVQAASWTLSDLLASNQPPVANQDGTYPATRYPAPPSAPAAYPETGSGGYPALTPPSARPAVPGAAGPGLSAAAGGGGLPPGAPGSPAYPVTPQSSEVEAEGTKVLAQVGTEVILMADVLPVVQDQMAANKSRIRSGEEEKAKEFFTRMALMQLVEVKMIYLDAIRTIPKENLPNFTKNLTEVFHAQFVPAMYKRMKVDSLTALDRELQKIGSSLAREKQAFYEKTLAQEWFRSQIKDKAEITHQEMLSYYERHAEEYDFPAKARWEQLHVRFRSAPTEYEAYAKLADLGNRVLDGQPFADVATAESDGPTADKGGFRDWTTKGSLVSSVLDEAVFSLPVGLLSQIVKDDDGFHIIRVIERTEAGRTPFADVHNQIKEALRNEKQEKDREIYLTKVRRDIPVWTVFDNEPEISTASESDGPAPF